MGNTCRVVYTRESKQVENLFHIPVNLKKIETSFEPEKIECGFEPETRKIKTGIQTKTHYN